MSVGHNYLFVLKASDKTQLNQIKQNVFYLLFRLMTCWRLDENMLLAIDIHIFLLFSYYLQYKLLFKNKIDILSYANSNCVSIFNASVDTADGKYNTDGNNQVLAMFARICVPSSTYIWMITCCTKCANLKYVCCLFAA